MFVNIIAKSKKSGEILTTDKDGLFATIAIQADGTFEIDEIGTCVDTLSKITPEAEETYLNIDDYEITDIKVIR